jgi:hypothetical protein
MHEEEIIKQLRAENEQLKREIELLVFANSILTRLFKETPIRF